MFIALYSIFFSLSYEFDARLKSRERDLLIIGFSRYFYCLLFLLFNKSRMKQKRDLNIVIVVWFCD